MPRYSHERRSAALSKLPPPHNRSIPDVASSEGISEATLYNWLKQARREGIPVPGSIPNTSDDWSKEAKFAVVLETASMTASELSEYCRSKGLYPEQVQAWREACMDGVGDAGQCPAAAQAHIKAATKQINRLEKELRRKDKALAETAALLVLQKKFQALLEDAER